MHFVGILKNFFMSFFINTVHTARWQPYNFLENARLPSDSMQFLAQKARLSSHHVLTFLPFVMLHAHIPVIYLLQDLKTSRWFCGSKKQTSPKTNQFAFSHTFPLTTELHAAIALVSLLSLLSIACSKVTSLAFPAPINTENLMHGSELYHSDC